MNIEKMVERSIELQANKNRFSHTELEPDVFHASQMGFCERQMYLSKLGIVQHNTTLLGIFRIGTLMHEFLEESIGEIHPYYELEKEVNEVIKHGSNHFVIKGHSDLYIPDRDLVVDFKSQNGWYYFDPYEDSIDNKDRHITQLSVYMYCLNAKRGKIVYLNKGDFEPREVPRGDTYFNINNKLLKEALARCSIIKEEIELNGYPQDEREIPFIKCGCFMCDKEHEHKLTFDHLPDEVDQ